MKYMCKREIGKGLIRRRGGVVSSHRQFQFLFVVPEYKSTMKFSMKVILQC